MGKVNMEKFGFTISKGRQIDYESNDRRIAGYIFEKEPSFRLCIECGGCSATCTTGNFTSFSLRELHILIKRGENDQVRQNIKSACSAENVLWFVHGESIQEMLWFWQNRHSKNQMNMQFDPFVIPFNIGLYFILIYVVTRSVIWFRDLSRPDKLRLQRGFFGNAFTLSLKEIFMESLIHRKILKTNLRLGYMHMSLAFGWFY